MEIYFVEVHVNQITAVHSECYTDPKAAIAEIRSRFDELREEITTRLYGNRRDEEHEAELAGLIDGWLRECESTGCRPDLFETEDGRVVFILLQKKVFDAFTPPKPSAVPKQ